MPIEDIASSPTDTVTELAIALGSIGRWLQALGLVIIIWLIIQIINWIINAKKLKAIYSIKEDVARLEKKLDKLSKKK